MSDLKDNLERFIAQRLPVQVVAGTVLAVRQTEQECDVRPDNEDADLLGVGLLNGIIPAVGAQALVGLIENRRTDTFLISADPVERFHFATASDSAGQWLADLCTALGQLTVTTGVGPSGPPINLPAFQQLAQRAGNLFTS